jgi:hypothetical protein
MSASRLLITVIAIAMLVVSLAIPVTVFAGEREDEEERFEEFDDDFVPRRFFFREFDDDFRFVPRRFFFRDFDDDD